jgi:hypothetical protein
MDVSAIAWIFDVGPFLIVGGIVFAAIYFLLLCIFGVLLWVTRSRAAEAPQPTSNPDWFDELPAES